MILENFLPTDPTHWKSQTSGTWGSHLENTERFRNGKVLDGKIPWKDLRGSLRRESSPKWPIKKEPVKNPGQPIPSGIFKSYMGMILILSVSAQLSI